MNICDYIIKNKLPYRIIDGKMEQVGTLDLINKNISSLDGFAE